MRVTALMPTRDRPATAARAAGTFLDAIAATGLTGAVTLVIVDDSERKPERDALALLVQDLAAARTDVDIKIVAPHGNSAARTVDRPGGGPGAARNRGLRHLRERRSPSEALVMFDDDVVFGSVVHDGAILACDGARLLSEALTACRNPRTITGCGYVGRQDLSILEHVQLEHDDGECEQVAPASERGAVVSVAPGGISTAFLAVSGSAAAVPDFPEHYNEDYVWLHAMARAGWRLERAGEPLVHAPPGRISPTPESLSFQIFGEIVWLGVLEKVRFPVHDATAMAAAVDEIVGDLDEALDRGAVQARPALRAGIAEVTAHYSKIGEALRSGRPTSGASALVAAIRAGIELAPVDPVHAVAARTA